MRKLLFIYYLKYNGLQLHIVTWNTSRYRTPQAAAASEQFDGLMVFGILIKVKNFKRLFFVLIKRKYFQIAQSDNEDVGKLIDSFTKITYKGEKINLDYGTVSLKNLMPSKI